MPSKNTHTYESLFEIQDGQSNEVHFALRDDGKYIISRCQVLKGGEKIYMRSSVTMTEKTAKDFARKLIETIGE